jgi:hypothetical protein
MPRSPAILADSTYVGSRKSHDAQDDYERSRLVGDPERAARREGNPLWVLQVRVELLRRALDVRETRFVWRYRLLPELESTNRASKPSIRGRALRGARPLPLRPPTTFRWARECVNIGRGVQSLHPRLNHTRVMANHAVHAHRRDVSCSGSGRQLGARLWRFAENAEAGHKRTTAPADGVS